MHHHQQHYFSPHSPLCRALLSPRGWDVLVGTRMDALWTGDTRASQALHEVGTYADPPGDAMSLGS